MKPIHELELFVFAKSIELMKQLTPQHKALWGQMDAQQMIEHLLISVEASSGKIESEITTPAEKVAQVKAIGLMSLRPFQREVRNALLPADPLPYRFNSIEEGIQNLESELAAFKNVFAGNASFVKNSNVFGPLNYEEWMWFHYKHFTHHLTQFGQLEVQERL